ncbi:6-phospho-3-hexuloisomerase [Paenibacillus sp. GYB004]|uniref:6-phospho-3-hexuloisomerase n=1 Tax=Paenibacillus sp. GYB004 TaxID=2994393 RepID=UPI002F969C04
MTTLTEILALTRSILQELDQTVKSIQVEEIERLVGQIAETGARAGRIFVAGAGRSGLMLRAFAMRLMHAGFHAYVVGEAVTPGLQAGDLLIIGSGSGETGSLVNMAAKAKKLGASVALATVRPDSTIGQMADTVIAVPAAAKERNDGSATTTIQPMGSLFEQSLLLLLDTVVLCCMDRLGIDSAAMFGRHANLE